MESKYLRIGNIVSRLGVIYEVWSLKKKELELDSAEYDRHINYATYDEIEPIPLTEEWHNKFGVTKNGFNNFEYELPRKFNIGIKVIHTDEYVMLRQGTSNPLEDDVISVWNKDVSRRDMYVHEWQNLYFALTGEELKINK